MTNPLTPKGKIGPGKLIGNQPPPLELAGLARAPATPRGGLPARASLPPAVRPSDVSEASR